MNQVQELLTNWNKIRLPMQKLPQLKFQIKEIEDAKDDPVWLAQLERNLVRIIYNVYGINREPLLHQPK